MKKLIMIVLCKLLSNRMQKYESIGLCQVIQIQLLLPTDRKTGTTLGYFLT